MGTSLNNIEETERFLSGKLSGQESVLFQAKLILDPTMRENMHWQEKTYVLIREYGRNKLRKELEEIHTSLFTNPVHSGFREKILRLFSKR